MLWHLVGCSCVSEFAAPGARDSSSGALGQLKDVDLHRLQSERQEWLADLDSLLEGNFASEDLDLAITLAKYVLAVRLHPH